MTGLAILDEDVLYGYGSGSTFHEGVSTTVSIYDAAYYVERRWQPAGYVYLIDAMDMAGFVVSHTMDTFLQPPVLEDIHYEVCFLAPIPNTSIVGFVLPEGHDPLESRWPKVIKRLNLTVNPEYWSGSEKGLTAAKKVAGLFNA
ncbi:hypothetical protein NX722_23035 [Endozoicomonas gorgoniicola]|uniref:Uncharacterized protein n=1 Tax=Endozoicomonas gorgoniicola TaxID=1234144 RepID=A0ABT3N1E2_9GAMM|nr:hypothetical protein [Endozoicomonas gorgoniicola]MCW7555446.1 hypothetical protein [Endozoicomonas gorgoniicola]